MVFYETNLQTSCVQYFSQRTSRKANAFVALIDDQVSTSPKTVWIMIPDSFRNTSTLFWNESGIHTEIDFRNMNNSIICRCIIVASAI